MPAARLPGQGVRFHPERLLNVRQRSKQPGTLVRPGPNPSIGIQGFSSQAERSPAGRAFVTAEGADAYDPFKLVLQVAHEDLPHIYLDSGTEDNLIRVAREFAQLLFEHDIPFDFMQMPGGHNPGYWTQAIGHSMSIRSEERRVGKECRSRWSPYH